MGISNFEGKLNEYLSGLPEDGGDTGLVRDAISFLVGISGVVEGRFSRSCSVYLRNFDRILSSLDYGEESYHVVISFCISIMWEKRFFYGENWSDFEHFILKRAYLSYKYVDSYFVQLQRMQEYRFNDLLDDFSSRKEDVISLVRDSKGEIAEFNAASEKMIDDFDARLDRLRGVAEGLQANYNFLGLSKSFSEQAEAAESLKKYWKNFTLRTSFLVLVPGLFDLLIFIFDMINGDNFFLKNAIIIGPVSLSLTLIMIYYFRVSLSQYKSYEAVALQYQHRKGICAFVEGYAEVKKKLTGSDQGVDFDKFEAMAFSSVTPDAGNIPATFDGVDQLAKLIEAFRKPLP